MTAEQREHIAAAIGIMDMGAAILRNYDYNDAADIMVTQCENLQELLDNDRRECDL